MDTITIRQAAEDFNNGRASLFYRLEGGEPAVLVNCGGTFGFVYLGRMNRPPKFRGVTATEAVKNALKAGRDITWTKQHPKIETP